MKTYSYITETAFRYANVAAEEVLDVCTHWEETLVEVDFTTEWMSYICYVDLSGEVLGFLSEPVSATPADEAVSSAAETVFRCA